MRDEGRRDRCEEQPRLGVHDDRESAARDRMHTGACGRLSGATRVRAATRRGTEPIDREPDQQHSAGELENLHELRVGRGSRESQRSGHEQDGERRRGAR